MYAFVYMYLNMGYNVSVIIFLFQLELLYFFYFERYLRQTSSITKYIGYLKNLLHFRISINALESSGIQIKQHASTNS